MKLVINGCYGGFGLSPKGLAHYYKLKGETLTFYDRPPGEYKFGADQVYNRIEGTPEGALFGPIASLKDLGETTTQKELFADGNYVTNHPSEEFRSDPDLVKTVEDLGSEADGTCASLRVVDIPDNVEYTIEEYDGIEWVAESHRTWK